MLKGRRDAEPNFALYNVRDARAETQEQTAAALNALAARRGETTAITGNHISRWERGVVQPSRLHSQLLAEHFGVTPADLGLTRQRALPVGRRARTVVPLTDVADVLGLADDTSAETDPRVVESQREWLYTRRAMSARRSALARTVAQLYPTELRRAAGMLLHPQWTPASLLDPADIELSFVPVAEQPEIDGGEELTRHVRPLRGPGQRFTRYSHAVRDVARPKLFENRPCWRLLDAAFSGSRGRLSFGHMNYFEGIDICEAVAHESAATHLANGGQVTAASWRGLRLRKAIGDPFDLRRRALLLSINTLTVRKDRTSASVLLHNRSADSVATSGGVIGVMPAGVFQPSTVRTVDHSADFDLWRNMMREFSEELLGNPEHAGDGAGADYRAEPLRSLDAARASGGVRVYCLGIGMSALDLWGAVETVAVFDADVFDEIFAGLVHVNDEGSVLRIGRSRPTVRVPLAKEVVEELCATDRTAPETAFSLRAAWKHRDRLLG
ncbi:MAG TPA: helix-turn-helix transcriptional regulator [Micromonosporaceae bacterium]|nr:helix-turn-helix transcriptional regulator [Micromonosporaceae bacterium]